MMTHSLLEAKNITYICNGISLFSKLNFTLMPGEVLQVLGNNGSGKTSLLKLLSGLWALDSGQVIRHQNSLLYLGHKLGIKLALTVMENLHEMMALQAVSTDVPLAKMLEHLHLQDLLKRPCLYLSAGQRQRVALARLFLVESSLWILDEPFAHLDAQTSAILRAQIEKHCAAGGGVVIATHHLGHFSARCWSLCLS